MPSWFGDAWNIFTAVIVGLVAIDRIIHRYRQTQYETAQALSGKPSMDVRVSALEDRMDDATNRWSEKHSETTTHIGNIELNIRELQTVSKRQTDDLRALMERRASR